MIISKEKKIEIVPGRVPGDIVENATNSTLWKNKYGTLLFPVELAAYRNRQERYMAPAGRVVRIVGVCSVTHVAITDQLRNIKSEDKLLPRSRTWRGSSVYCDSTGFPHGEVIDIGWLKDVRMKP